MKETERLKIKGRLAVIAEIQDPEIRLVATAQLKCSINNIAYRDWIKAKHRKGM